MALIALLLWVIVLPFHGMYQDYRESIEDSRFRLNRLQKIGAQKPRLEQDLDKLKSGSQGDDTFFATQTPSLAAADLQAQIKQTITDAGGELTSTQVVPESNEETFVRIAVKVRMTGNTPILKEVLYGFESAKPFLFVENLNIRPIRIPVNPRLKDQPIPDKLSIDFEVAGYMQSP